MKRTFIMALMVAIAYGTNLHAQKIELGVHSGVNVSGFTGGTPYKVYDKLMKIGYEAGGDIRLALGCGWALYTGISLVEAGGKFATMSDYVSATGQGMTEYSGVTIHTLAVEIPVKLGYDIVRSENFRLTPFVGVFGRYSIASIQSHVQMAGSDTSVKWNCLKAFNQESHHIDALKRFDAGTVMGVESLFSGHYLFSADYRRGFTDRSPQFNLKQQGFTFSLGYRW